MPDTQAFHTFLPSLRQGLTTSVNVTDTLGTGVPGRLVMPVQVAVNNAMAGEVRVRFYGPGDILGIDPREIVRTEPNHRYTAFGPNLFPLVEFDRPDFPWLFTPANANVLGRLRPWLCLVVVPKREDVQVTFDPRRPLPVLECPLDELPELADSSWWAHVQIARSGNGAANPSIEDILRHYPERTVSRLLCPRRLEPNMTYLACVVPTFEAGRKAGLGEPLTESDEAELRPAWHLSAPGSGATIRLPVYYHWEFGTGQAEDFEALARRLKVRAVSREVGLLHVDVHAPGWGILPRSVDDLGAVLELEGVLRGPTTSALPWSQQARADFEQQLRSLLNGSTNLAEGPVVKPPAYGQEQAGAFSVPDDAGLPHWLHELNLDPRYRIAAGLGAMVVRYEQERLMASAWTQLAATERNIQEQRRIRFSQVVGDALTEKHLAALNETTASTRALAARSASASLVVRQGEKLGFISHANGSLARRLQVQGQLAPDVGFQVDLLSSPTARLDSRSARTAATQEEVGLGTEPFRFAPQFSQPTVEFLRDYFPYMLLPGLSQVPPNTIALLETNPVFVEAFMVGLNHEMGRELLWREFPVDRRGTFFRHFWTGPRQAVVAQESPLTSDLPPIATWEPSSHLGDHLLQGLGDAITGTDPELTEQIQAAQADAEALAAQLVSLKSQIDVINQQRDEVDQAGEPQRILLRDLRSQLVMIDTRQFERAVANNAGLAWDVQAQASHQKAAVIRAGLDPLRARLVELQAIAAQILILEADLEALLTEVNAWVQQIEGLSELANQLSAQRQAALTAGTDARRRLSDAQIQVATIPSLQIQLAATEQEMASYLAQAQSQRDAASEIRARAAPARERVAELEALANQSSQYKEAIPAVEFEIRILEERIAEHLLNKPPATPVWRYNEWLAQLEKLESELADAQAQLDDLQRIVVDIEVQLEQLPVLWAEIEHVESEAAPYDAEAATAEQAAAAASVRVTSQRGRITQLRSLAAAIPAIEAEIRAADTRVLALTREIDALPARAAEMEAARAEVQNQADVIADKLAGAQEQVTEMPDLQNQIAAAEAEAAVHDQQEATAQLAAQQARARVVSLSAEIAELETATAQIPSVEAEIEAVETAKAALAQQIDALQTQLAERASAHQAAQATIVHLVTEQTMRTRHLVLLIRGDLLRRFSRASIYAVEAAWVDSEHTQRRLGTAERYPLFHGTWGNDVTFLGFPMTGQEARGGADHPGWFFVVQEQATEPRFGLDASTGVWRSVEDILTWDDVSWDDLVEDPGDLSTLVHVPVDGRLMEQERQVGSGSASGSLSARWGQNSAHMAVITQQKPIRMAVHASAWLP